MGAQNLATSPPCLRLFSCFSDAAEEKIHHSMKAADMMTFSAVIVSTAVTQITRAAMVGEKVTEKRSFSRIGFHFRIRSEIENFVTVESMSEVTLSLV